MTLLIPAPDVKADFRATQYGHAGVDCFLEANTTGIKIRPEDRITFDRLERYTFIVALALNETTPSLVQWPLQPREVGLQCEFQSSTALRRAEQVLTPPPSQSALKYTMNVLTLLDLGLPLAQSK